MRWWSHKEYGADRLVRKGCNVFAIQEEEGGRREFWTDPFNIWELPSLTPKGGREGFNIKACVPDVWVSTRVPSMNMIVQSKLRKLHE